MSLEELFLYALMAIGLSSVMVSLYLWFVCKARTGMLLWSSYALRAACGVTPWGLTQRVLAKPR